MNRPLPPGLWAPLEPQDWLTGAEDDPMGGTTTKPRVRNCQLCVNFLH
jgi:hypothetical protein